MGMYKLALEVCEEMIRLNKNDYMGARYMLLKLYVGLEELEKAEILYNKFKMDKSVRMIFPMSVIYLRAGNFTKAKTFLNRAARSNQYFIR